MPTSKDILIDSEKNFKKNKIVKLAFNDIVKIGTTDVAEFAKARANLASSMNSMKGSMKNLEDQIKKLNAGLSTLNKSAPVMKAPADNKKYKVILKMYNETIKDGMKYYKEIKDLMKTAQQLRKS